MLASMVFASVDYLVLYHDTFTNSNGWQTNLENVLEDQGHELAFQTISNGDTYADISNSISSLKNTVYTDLEFVLLVGKGKDGAIPSGEIYPVTNSTASSSNGNYIPYYYYNDNHYWAGDTIDIPSDQQYVENLYLQIGRIPVESTTEINNWISKLEDYYKSFSKYSSYKNRIRHLSQNNDNIDNHCKRYQAELKIKGSTTLHIDTLKYDFVANFMTDVHDSVHCVHTTAADELFRTKIEEGAGITIVSGTGSDPFNFAGFFFPPGTSTYSFSNAKSNFIFGNTCAIGNTSHPGYTGGTGETVLENLLTDSNDGIVGAYAPTVNIGTHSSYVADHVYTSLLMGSGMRHVGEIADAFQTFVDTITSVNYLDLNHSFLRRNYYYNQHDYHYKSMVLYGDPSMPLALNSYVSSNISSDTTWSGSIIVENDITINSGVTLTIQPGTGVFFEDDAQLKVQGTLIAEGTTSYPIVFSGASTSPSVGDWDGIYFDNSSVDANCRIKNCKIEYADCGITCYYANPTIQNDSIAYCTAGVSFVYSSPSNFNSNYVTQCTRGIVGNNSSPTLTNNKVTDCSDKGIYFFLNSSPKLFSNTVEDSYYGTYFYWQCYPEFGPVSGSNKGENVIKSNFQNIYGSDYSDPFLGSTDAYNNRIGGYNALYSSSDYNVYMKTNSDLMAHWCWWGSNPPAAIKFYNDASSTISRSNHLTSLPSNIGSSLAKAAMFATSEEAEEEDLYTLAGFDPKNPNPNKLSDLWLWAHDLTITGQDEEAINVYKKLIDKFSADDLSKKALVKMAKLHKEAEKENFKQYLNTIVASTDKNLRPSVHMMLVHYFACDNEIDKAIKEAEKIVDKYPDSKEEISALYSLIMFEKDETFNLDKAKAYLNDMKIKYPYEEMTLLAREQMGEKVDWSLLDMKALVKKNSGDVEEILIPDEYALHHNYPNPFNPVTTIEFDLPEAAKVSLVIYDITGREIARLVDQQAPAGYHSIVWNGMTKFGGQAASGVYIYRLNSDNFSDVKKMLLVR